ncbi:MAG: NF038122 family metalloprotease [Acidobacteriota bacterium]|nr:NF038122 family metalloprotease [Blastocatellia bacterium]MDW8412832.1 NF038122 family metalloprotease [Acidobacteriota bacterium]
MHKPKLRRLSVALLLAIGISGLLAWSGTPLSANSSAQEETPEIKVKKVRKSARSNDISPYMSIENKLKPVKEGSMYIIYHTSSGIECKEATLEEIEYFRRDPNQKLKVIKPVNPNQSSGLKIMLRGTQQLESFPAAKASFIKAASIWEQLIADNITIVIDVDFGPTRFGTPYPPGVLGSASPQLLGGNIYTDVRNALRSNPSSQDESTLYNALPSSSLPIDVQPGNTTRMVFASAALRAQGLIAPVADPTGEQPNFGPPPSIGFNSNFAFDFDPSNGIDRDKTDFEGTAVHEIGHVLGFNSSVGFSTPSPSVWDLFRFRPGVNSSTFSTAARLTQPGGDHVYFVGGQNNSTLPLSTARPDGTGGDGFQASHWKDDSFTGQVIGIMDPAIANGELSVITQNDILALDRFGYEIRNTNDPPPQVTVTEPAAGAVLEGNSQATISWQSTDNGTIISHEIALSTDSGATFPITISSGVAGSARSFRWSVPNNIETTKARIRVTAVDNSFGRGSGVNPGDFTIKKSQIDDRLPAPKSLTATANAGTVTLNWSKPDDPPPPEPPTTVVKPTGLGTQASIIDDIESGILASPELVVGEQITPTQYPATLKSVYYLSLNRLFEDENKERFPDPRGAKFRLYVFTGATGARFSSTPPTNVKTYEVTIEKDFDGTGDFKEFDSFNEFVIPDNITITSGSFFVGLQFVSVGTSKLENAGDYVFGMDTDAPSTAFASVDSGRTFIGVGIQSSGRPLDFIFLGKVASGSAGEAPKLTGYNIYRSTTSPVAITSANKIGSVPATATTFTDNPKPADGRRYHYAVTAVYDKGESRGSNEASATPNDGGAPTFSMTVTPSSQNVIAGSSATFTISITGSGGFNQPVTLSATASSNTVTTSFSPATVNPGGTSTLTVATSSSTPAGQVTVTITGQGGGITQTAVVTLNVTVPDFAIQPVPATVKQKTSATLTVNIARTGGFTGNVSVSLDSKQLSDLKIKLKSSNPVSTTGNSVTFSVKLKKTPTGTQTLTVTGRDDAGRVRTGTLTLTVTQ